MAFLLRNKPPKAALDEGIERLRAGIVKQAVQDYMFLLRHPRCSVDGRTKADMERWFRSKDFKLICDLDPEEILKRCKVMVWQKKNCLKTR